MTDLVFLTESSLFDRDIQGEISRTFYAKFVSNRALNLADSATILWIIVRRNSEYFVQSRLKADLIQRYTQGRMSGLYVIRCSKNFGGHIYPPNDLRTIINLSSQFEMFPECDTVDVISHSLERLISNNYEATLRRTNLRLINDSRRKFLMLYVERNTIELSTLSINQIELELRNHFYESELLLLASLPNNKDPYLSTAVEIFSIINDVPLAPIRPPISEYPFASNTQRVRKYYTDCVLRSFTEDDLVAREMVWNPDNFGEDKFKAGLLKTNLAEQRHQEMLRQLIGKIGSKGLTPLGSSSIDLAIEFNDAIAIFEIKSSTIENYKDQAFKGCNQLAEYALNLSGKKSKDVLKFLILEVPYGGGVDIEYVSDICKLMNVTTIDFYFDKEWPDRCVLDFGSWTTLRSKLPQP